MTADQDVELAASEADVDALVGAGSECALQAYEALAANAIVILAPVAEAGGAQAGTQTLTWTTLGSGTGTLGLWTEQGVLSWSVDTASNENTADNCLAAINAKPKLGFAATKGAGPDYVVTLTTKSKGVRMNDFYTKLITTDAPTGNDTTHAGGTPTSSGMVPFTGGSGADSVANVIDLLEAAEYKRIAVAQNDATNAALFEAHVDSEASPLIEHLEQAVFGHNGASSAAVSLAQTTLNAFLCQVAWCRYSVRHPSQIAARVAATRAVFEQQNPNVRAAGAFADPASKLWTTNPQLVSDVPSHAEINVALAAGVSPIMPFAGTTRLVYSITSYSLNGTDPDDRCWGTNCVTVPQYAREQLRAVGQEYLESNPGVGPDLPDGQPQLTGVGTPSIWNGIATKLHDDLVTAGYLMSEDDDGNESVPISEWNAASKRIDTIFPCIVRPHQLQLANLIEQVAI
jgi:phage tail sheath gpL-like